MFFFPLGGSNFMNGRTYYQFLLRWKFPSFIFKKCPWELTWWNAAVSVIILRGEPVGGGNKIHEGKSWQQSPGFREVLSGLLTLWVKMKHSRHHLGCKDKNCPRHLTCQQLFLYSSTLRKWEQINFLLFIVIQSKILYYSHTIRDDPLAVPGAC